MVIYPINATATINGTAYSMTNRRPDKGLPYTNDFIGNIFTSQSGHEVRSSRSRRSKRKFNVTYTNLNGGFKTAIENFFRDRQGEYESFEFDLLHIGMSGTILARFSGGLSVTQVLSTLDERTSFYNVSFTLEETYS